MGWDSCMVKQKLEVCRLWLRLRSTDMDRITYKIHAWSLSTPKSWETKTKKFLQDRDLTDFLIHDVDKIHCLNIAKIVLSNEDRGNWYRDLWNDIGNENGNKLRTYRKYKYCVTPEYYVTTIISRHHRKCLAKFRCGNLKLNIETGRYTVPKTPLHERVCRLCSSNHIEDETNFLIDCDFYDDLRNTLLEQAGVLNPTFF